MSIGNCIADAGSLHRYRTEIPNLVLDMLATGQIDQHDLALYVILKRTAGDRGACWKTSATLATESGVSAGQLVKAKAKLRDLGLIDIASVVRNGHLIHEITIIDVWEENMARFAGSSGSSGEPARSSGEPARSSGEPARSSGEPARSPGEPARSSGEPKKEPFKKNPLKKNQVKKGGTRVRAASGGRADSTAADKPPRPRDAHFDAFVAAFSLPADAGRHASLAGEFSRDCKGAGATIDEFRDFFRAYRAKWGQYEFTVHGVTRAFLAWRVRERGVPAALAAAPAAPADDDWGWDFEN